MKSAQQSRPQPPYHNCNGRPYICNSRLTFDVHTPERVGSALPLDPETLPEKDHVQVDYPPAL